MLIQSGSCRSMGTKEQCPELAFKNKTERTLGVWQHAYKQFILGVCFV